MIFLFGLTLTAALAGCFTYLTEKRKIKRVVSKFYHELFEELFLETLTGKRPDPWTIDWSTVSYSRYEFSEEVTDYIKRLAYLDYMRCKDYSRGMRCDIWENSPYGKNEEMYYVIPHMLRQGYYWNLYDPIRWRYIYSAWYQYTVLKDVKMDRNFEQRWKYEVWLQQPKTGGLYQKIFGEELPPNNYPHKGEMIFDYFPNYDEWYGPSSNDPDKLHLVPKGFQKRWLDNLPWFNQKYKKPFLPNRRFGR